MIIIKQISMYMYNIQLNISFPDDQNVQYYVRIALCLLNQKCSNSADDNSYNESSLLSDLLDAILIVTFVLWFIVQY